MAKSNSGHYLEEAVEKEFKKINFHAFRWRRLPDSRAARGLIPSQPADYFISLAGKTAHVECKSDGSKTQRLPKFDQHAELVTWSTAGVKGFIITHFHELELLKLVDVDDLPFGQSSWSLRDYPNYETVGEVIEKILETLKK